MLKMNFFKSLLVRQIIAFEPTEVQTVNNNIANNINAIVKPNYGTQIENNDSKASRKLKKCLTTCTQCGHYRFARMQRKRIINPT